MPYDSITSVAKLHYAFFPVSLLLRHPFNSLQLVPAITSLVLMLVAVEDSIVPVSHSRSRADHWSGKVDFIEIEKADHNTISFFHLYRTAIQDCLKMISR